MYKIILKIGRILASIVIGYAVIVLGTTLTFEVLLGGVGYYKSSPSVLAVAGLGAFLTGFAGGCVATLIGGRPYLLSAAGVLLLLIMDTTYVISSGISKDPVWFDLIGSGTLMVSTLIGGYVIGQLTSKKVAVTAEPNERFMQVQK